MRDSDHNHYDIAYRLHWRVNAERDGLSECEPSRSLHWLVPINVITAAYLPILGTIIAAAIVAQRFSHQIVTSDVYNFLTRRKAEFKSWEKLLF